MGAAGPVVHGVRWMPCTSPTLHPLASVLGVGGAWWHIGAVLSATPLSATLAPATAHFCLPQEPCLATPVNQQCLQVNPAWRPGSTGKASQWKPGNLGPPCVCVT